MSEHEDDEIIDGTGQEDELDTEPETYYDDSLSGNTSNIDLTQFQTPFSKEDLVNAYSLRNSYYKKKLGDMIDDSDLYESGKRAFLYIVNNFFDQTWKLAHLERKHSTFMNKNSTSGSDEFKGAMLSLKLALLKSSVSMCRSDRNSPDFIVLETNIKSHFRAFISQAKNGRERGYQARSKVVQENIMRNIEEKPQPNPTKERKKLF